MTWNRLISLLVAAAYLVSALSHGGMEPAVKVGLFLILPLACIWFAHLMGGYTGPAASMSITAPSPGLMVCILGWLLLMLPVVIKVIG